VNFGVCCPATTSLKYFGTNASTLLVMHFLPPQHCHLHTSRSPYTTLILDAVPMTPTQTWVAAVRDAGDLDPPPDAQIPADYLQTPRRQHPATAQSPPYHRHPLHLSVDASSRKRAVVTEIDLPNNPHPHKRQRVPNDAEPQCAMSQTSRSPSKTSIRIATRKAEDKRNKAQAADYGADLNASPRPGRGGRSPAPGLPNPPIHIPALAETNIPQWIPTSSASHDKCIDEEDVDQPKSSISSVTRSTCSKARSRSPTKRMIDLKVAEKTVSLKTVKSPADVPEDVRKLYKEIQGLARVPRGVIPMGIEVRI
jgi:hypothetical protein